MKSCCRRQGKRGKKSQEKVEETHKWVWRPFMERKSMCISQVLKRTKKTNCFGCNKYWEMFSNQYDKRGYREIE
jgi:hypothetical protein